MYAVRFDGVSGLGKANGVGIAPRDSRARMRNLGCTVAIAAALGLTGPVWAANPFWLASSQSGSGATTCARDQMLASHFTQQANVEDEWAAFDREQAQFDQESGKPAKEARAADLDLEAQKDEVVAAHDAAMAARYHRMAATARATKRHLAGNAGI